MVIAARQPGAPDRAASLHPPAWSRAGWVVGAVLLAATAMRLYGLGEWSLWEDEETTIFFSHHPDRRFPRAFPIFFVLLGWLYDITGVSVLAGRLLSASFGILSLALTYAIARRFAGERVALAALVLAAVSPGHLFWSQSIRYYGLVLCLQLASIWLLLEGIRRLKPALSIASPVTLALAAATHISALLLLPVQGAYLFWLAWWGGLKGRRGMNIAVAAAGLAALAVSRLNRTANVMASSKAYVFSAGVDPLHLVVTGVFYFGLPAVALAAIGAWRVRTARGPESALFLLLGLGLPAGLVALTFLKSINVTYYYGLVALPGVAILAGFGVEWVAARRRRDLIMVALACFAYYVPVLAAYYGPSYGDRPRWREAAALVGQAQSSTPELPVFAQVPGVVAFYLGVPPDQTMGHPSVTGWRPETDVLGHRGLYVLEDRLLTGASRDQFQKFCTLVGRVDSRMLVRDRAVVVYVCRAPSESM
jgi:4-amino-4-deoxy-L-arabinose transferase-like glycosyltransferase